MRLIRLINEDIEPQTKKIASLTGTRADAVKQFVSTHSLNITKLLKFIEKGKLSDRMDFVTALSGKPGNPIQKKVIKMFSESITEAKTYKKGDKLKIKLPNGKKFDVVFDMYSRTKGVALGKFKDNHGEYNIKPFDLKSIVESVNEAELKLGVKYTNKQGKEGFIQTGGSTNPKDWFWFDGKTKHPYDKVKKELKPSKDQKKTGFGDYLKQGGRVWDNVNKNGNLVKEAKFGYKDSTASYINKHNNEYKIAEKLNKGNEIKFYDELQKIEDKIGHPKFMLFISSALRGYGVDMYKDPKIKNPQDAQEALFLLSK